MDAKQSLIRAGIKAGTATHVAIYRLTEGRVDAEMNGDVILLTTKGRTSGKLRTTPVMRIERDGALHVIGSAGGADRDPAWFRNLMADPRVRVRDRDRVWDARAVVLGGRRAGRRLRRGGGAHVRFRRLRGAHGPHDPGRPPRAARPDRGHLNRARRPIPTLEFP